MKLFSGKTETKISTEPQQTISKKRLSIDVRILSILVIVCGVAWIFYFSSHTKRDFYAKKGVSSLYIVMVLLVSVLGAEMIMGGVGMLKRKYWGLQLTQALVILVGVILCLLYAPAIAAQLERNQKDLGFLLPVSTFSIFLVLLLWFLFKKSTVDQFKTHSEKQNKGIEVDFTEKK